VKIFGHLDRHSRVQSSFPSSPLETSTSNPTSLQHIILLMHQVFSNMVPFGPLTVHLPPVILVHSLLLSLLGLYLVFRRREGHTRQTQLLEEAWGMAGITIFALGIAYLATSYMPIEENQLLHASVPVRILLAALALLRLLSTPKMTSDGRGQMLFVILYDGLGGILCGWQLGRWDGRVSLREY
jgi:hypothetical protein